MNKIEIKNVYLSGAVTGYESIVDNVFDRGERIARAVGAQRVFNPTREIERTSTWDDAMTVCRRALSSGEYDTMFVLDSNATRASRGANEEIEIAKNRGMCVMRLDFQSSYDIL